MGLAQLDRAAGVLPGQWTDDTSMAIAIAEVAAAGFDLRSVEAQDQIAQRWTGWAAGAPDVGVQTRQVLIDPQPGEGHLSTRMRWAAFELDQRTGRSAGDGSLMRTAPVALAHLGDPEALIKAAHAISNLTLRRPGGRRSRALWCLGIRGAVLHGSFDGVHEGLRHLPPDRRLVWARRLPDRRAAPIVVIHEQRVGRRSVPGRLVRHPAHARHR